MQGFHAGPNAIPGWERHDGKGPIAAVALHNGHQVPPELANLMAVTEKERLREEAPYTGEWTAAAPNRLVVRQSRFLFDLNRPPEKALFLEPEDAGGLNIWKTPPSGELARELLSSHDDFYQEVKHWFDGMAAQWGRFVVLDLHAYNHRRQGPDAPPGPVEDNPEINIGTGTMNRDLWAPLVERFMGDLRNFDFLGKSLDVRENVRFRGGAFPAWAHDAYPASACVLSVEVKKFFMDEWTGDLYPDRFDALGQAFRATLPGILEELKKMEEA